MKLIKISFIVFLSIFLSSCGDDLAELNVDPNTSPTANPAQVLTAGMGYYGISLDGYFNEDNAILAQYWAGGPGVNIIDIEKYTIVPGDFNTEWAFAFNQALSDLDYVIDNGNNNRAAVADILSVCIFQNLVDHYGDIPYSEALRGSIEDGSILTPKFDGAQSVYSDLITRLDAAIEKFDNSELGEEDLMYEGNIGNWVKFANSLKLRLLMRQSDNGDGSIGDQVRDLISNGSFVGASNEIARIPFNGETGNWNPQYARREQGIKQFYVLSTSFSKALEDRNDPRLLTLFDPAVNTETIVGMKQGNVNDLVTPSKDDFSFPTAVQYGNDNDVILMSHWEVMFLRAEAAMRYGTSDSEKGMFDNAVSSHFDYIGTEGASDYLNSDAVYDEGASVELKANLIGVQKWISMCGLQESEGWIESRRFDVSGSNIFTNGTSGIFNTPTRSILGDGVFPSIRLYPQSEIDFNPNTPSGRKITDKVFWDK